MDDKGIMKVSEPVLARPLTSYADVMTYLHTIHLSPEDKRRVASRLTLEVTGKNLSRTFERLDHLSSLPAGWDGYDALPLSRKVVQNLKEVLLISDDDDWKYWMISPAPNGSLSLQSKRHVASISVGDREFSYYSSTNDGEKGESHLNFTPVALLEIMQRIV